MSSLYNLDLELNYIAGLLQYPDTYIETDFITVQDFSKQNGDIFGVIKNIIESGAYPTPVIIADKCNSLSIQLDGIDIKDFCDSLLLRGATLDKKAVLSIAKELKKKSFVRRVHSNADKLKKEIVEKQNGSPLSLVKIVDNYLGDSILSFDGEIREPTNLSRAIPDIVEEYGNNPDESPYISMPYDSWNENLGKLRPGDVFYFMARAGSGKSTLLLDIMRKLPDANPDKNLSVLYLDTEMKIEDAALRYVAGAIGCPYYLIDSRQWRKDTKWAPLIRKGLDKIRNSKNQNLWFEPIGNMSAQEMEKFIKRFYLKHVGRGNPFVIIYDYFKINNKDKNESGNIKEYELAYTKSEIIKDVSVYCDAVALSAFQSNRSGIVNGRQSHEIDDSEGQGSISDRMGWLAAFIGILRRRTPDEVLADSFPNNLASSHKLIPTKMRYLGRSGPEFQKFVKIVKDNKVFYKPNFINLNIDNFAVTDMGTYSSWLNRNGITPATNSMPQQANPL